jgi:S-adenosyl methyltransferase
MAKEAETETETAADQDRPVPFDTSVAHIARVYNYWLGGKDNFAADREAGDQALAVNPGLQADVRANRAFLARAVRYLAGEAGITQFLDIGTGIPTENNTHEVAQAIAPAARIVYVDNDPVVLTHARALLTSSPQGATAYIDSDLRDTTAILRQAAAALDFTQPIAVMLIAILHLIGDGDDPYGIVTRLMDAVPPGSYLAISHPAGDIEAGQMASAARRVNRLMAQQVTLRSQDAVTRFFGGLQVVEPGIVQPPRWRPAGSLPDAQVRVWAGIGRKP